LVKVFVQHQPAGRAAGLSSPREVHAGKGRVGHLVRIGVGIDDERVLAAEVKRERLDAALRRRALDRHAGRHRAGERDALDTRMRLAICLRYFPRSLISSAAQAGCAFSAAATALFTSAASPAGNSPIFSSVAGLTDSIQLSASPETIWPPISIWPFIWACTFI